MIMEPILILKGLDLVATVSRSLALRAWVTNAWHLHEALPTAEFRRHFWLALRDLAQVELDKPPSLTPEPDDWP
jgi:hypothetical protein